MFKKGISFISKDQEEVFRNKLIQTLEEKSMPKSTLYPSNNKDIRAQIDAVL